LAETAYRLGHGDLSVRVDPDGPPEIEEVGLELNRLANQIERLLQQERETAADLAHRLRTPLTAARLSVEGLDDESQKERLNRDLDELERTTDFIINEARRPVRREVEEWCDLADVASARVDFWSPLATEQGRSVNVTITSQPAPLALPQGDVEAVIDALIENVLSHTADGVEFLVDVERDGADAVFVVEDAGPGFVDGSAVDRGSSSGESTGLGLDIVRRTVEEAGGSLTVGESQALGGAGAVVRFPIDSDA
ncbi:MAG: HAMP domain-containing sensor histidine kinase, partial [Actinomycetota bacterium]